MANTTGTTEQLRHLIESHKQAFAADEAAYALLVKIDDSEEMEDCPIVRVQVGRLRTGVDADGNQTHRPIYAYDADQVTHEANNSFEYGVGLYFRRDNEPLMAKHRQKWDDWAAEKIAVLRTKAEERKLIEDACGYTDAKAAAEAASDAVKAIERQIVDFFPEDLDAARLKALWIVSNSGFESGYLEAKDIIDALKTIAAPVETWRVAE